MKFEIKGLAHNSIEGVSWNLMSDSGAKRTASIIRTHIVSYAITWKRMAAGEETVPCIAWWLAGKCGDLTWLRRKPVLTRVVLNDLPHGANTTEAKSITSLADLMTIFPAPRSSGEEPPLFVLAVPLKALHSGFCLVRPPPSHSRKSVNMWSSLVSLLFAVGAAQAKYIVPGGRWHDTDGNLVNAHAGGVTVDAETGKFFWFGEYKIEGQEEGGGVTVYSSEDLATWTYEGLALGECVERCSGMLPSDSIRQNPSRVTLTSPRSTSSRGRRLHTARAWISTT